MTQRQSGRSGVRRIRIGVLGAGPFANHLIPLFKAHPLVEEVRLAEKLAERREQTAARHGLAQAYGSYEELLASDVDAIGIFSQRWTHAPQAVKALRAGKHVFSAVPAGVTLEELDELVATVKRTGRIYMMGETSYYEGATILCRKQFRRGQFGRFVYAHASYCHDMEHGFYPPYQIANGPEWKRFASFPPMLYPTHSVGQILGVTGARMTRVSCLGQVDRHADGVFDRSLSFFDNDFSNETALFRSSDGGMCRANEFRRVSGGDGLAVRGTLAAFGNSTWFRHDRTRTDLSAQLATAPWRPELQPCSRQRAGAGAARWQGPQT